MGNFGGQALNEIIYLAKYSISTQMSDFIPNKHL
jgi:hypothetical protein